MDNNAKTLRKGARVRAAILLVLLLVTASSLADVDSAWLKSWNESKRMQPSNLAASGHIAAEGEPGIPLVIRGQVFNPDGTTASNVVVHAYHRDSDGFEFGSGDSAVTTWDLQGWVKTNESGQFKFQTIRPAADHLGREGSHVHFTLDSQTLGRQWAPKIFFADDSLVTKEQRKQSRKDGQFGAVKEVRTIDGVQYVNVAIRLKAIADF